MANYVFLGHLPVNVATHFSTVFDSRFCRKPFIEAVPNAAMGQVRVSVPTFWANKAIEHAKLFFNGYSAALKFVECVADSRDINARAEGAKHVPY